MLAYHNDPSIKAKYLARVQWHRAADDLVQRKVYWSDGKGCAVGCTIYSDDHTAYETELGIPVMLAWFEERIFDDLPIERAREWPEQFLDAVAVGADLSLVGWKLLRWLLTDETKIEGKGERESITWSLVARCVRLLAPLTEGREASKRSVTAAAKALDEACAVVLCIPPKPEKPDLQDILCLCSDIIYAMAFEVSTDSAMSASEALIRFEKERLPKLADKLLEMIRDAPVAGRSVASDPLDLDDCHLVFSRPQMDQILIRSTSSNVIASSVRS